MLFPFFNRERRPLLPGQPFPVEWRAILEQNVLLYRTLPETEQAKLRELVQEFVAGKVWEGCAGLVMTDEIRVTIAAQACLLVLGFEDYCFDEVQSILVYPGGFLATDPTEDTEWVAQLSGVAHHGGPVILSWWDARWDGRRGGQTNLVIHEFAHKLAELGDPAAGTPPIEDADFEQRWEEVMAAEYRQLCEAADYDRPTLLDHYGASNRAEFFAVATECFFLQPVQLRHRHAGLYQVLAEWYRQDPAAQVVSDEDESARADLAEHEYNQHVIAECTVAIRQRPDHAPVYRSRALYYVEEREHEKAVADYTALIRLTPDDAEAFCERGVAYREQGCHDLAVADFDRAIQLLPGFARAYCERGVAYAAQGDLGRALGDLNRAIRLDPKDDKARSERGRIHHEQDHFDKAVRDFSKAIRLCPDEAAYHVHRSKTYLSQGEFDRAIADCTEAMGLDPRKSAGYRTRALALRALGDCEHADEDDRQADKFASPADF